MESSVKPISKKSPWDFTQPEYDERTTCFVNAGSHYGVGHKQPVGHAGDAKGLSSGVIPQGRVKTLQVTDIPTKNYPIDMQK